GRPAGGAIDGIGEVERQVAPAAIVVAPDRLTADGGQHKGRQQLARVARDRRAVEVRVHVHGLRPPYSSDTRVDRAVYYHRGGWRGCEPPREPVATPGDR